MLFRARCLIVWTVFSAVILFGIVACERQQDYTPTVRDDASLPKSEIAAVDLLGNWVNPLAHGENKPIVFLFTKTDCPISNRYAPEVNRLYDRFSGDVRFYLVYADPAEDEQIIQKHRNEYGYQAEALRDPKHSLVRYTGASVTPEAVVVLPKYGILYRGRIDNRHVDFGKSRREATKRDLEDFLQGLVRGETLDFQETEAVGCYIPKLR